MKHSESALERFRAKLGLPDDAGCVLYMGAIANTGYGAFTVGRKNFSAHRVAYAMHHGEVPDDLQVRHLCHVRRCCAKDHLATGTQIDNEKDKVAAGRQATGERLPQTKLTANQVVEVVRLLGSGVRQKDVARRFGVCKGTISHIHTGRNRKDITRATRSK